MSDQPPPEEAPAASNDKNKSRDEACRQATNQMFHNVSEYIKGEIFASTEDYKLLEQMNRAVSEKYAGMTTQAVTLHEQMTKLQQRYAQIQPYLDQIDDVDHAVSNLEETACVLDDYTRRLEAKYKQLVVAARKS